jgi:outer membrane PBP1 activator LpoA protein
MMQRSARSVIALASTLALLVACSSSPVAPTAGIEAQAAAARSAADRGDQAQARELYALLVRQSTGDDQSRYRLELARAELGLGNAEGALATLEAIAAPRPEDLEVGMAAVRADALFALGRTVEAVRLLIDREIWLESAAEILGNQERIWNGLARPESLAAAGAVSGDSIVDGWLALAPLAGRAVDAEQFRAALLDWRQRYPGHPAGAGILAERLAAYRTPGARAPRIALLLPLSSELRVQTLAIQDGIFASHFASGHADDTTIRVYDTARQGSVESYQIAQAEGAELIIGPLSRSDVVLVQQQAGFLPTLALNVSTEEAVATTNFFQFALSSDDEIAAIATRAIEAGHETAVVLHASDPDGYRLGDAFRAAFEARGGGVIATSAYLSNGQNLAGRIEMILNIDRSTQRLDRLERDLGRSIEFPLPRRRADIDMIFLQAVPADARLLVPQLKNNGAADIPIYALSDLYDPNRAAGDPQLNQVIFPDLPILLDPVGEARVAAEQLSAFSSPSASQYKRLFAFGFDAYLLAQTLYAGDAASWPIAGATGELHLEESGRVRRSLPFAVFDNGRPRGAGAVIETTRER